MAISSDILVERNKMRQQVTFWRILFVVSFVIFGVLCVEQFREQENAVVAKPNTPYIARLTLAGVIAESRRAYDFLDRVAENDAIEAVIIHLNSPGGTAVAGEVFYKKLKALSQRKPVVTTMRDICTSACYMISLGADYSLAMAGTITGSIGVIFQGAEFSQLADTIGVKPVIVKSGQYKGSPSPTSPLKSDERAIVQSVIDDFHENFVRLVARERDIDLLDMRSIADGRIYSTSQSVSLGLIDAIGGEEEAKQWLVEEREINASLEIKTVENKTKLDKFFDQIGWNKAAASLFPVGSKSHLQSIWSPSF